MHVYFDTVMVSRDEANSCFHSRDIWRETGCLQCKMCICLKCMIFSELQQT